jgi:alkaline phosphatase
MKKARRMVGLFLLLLFISSAVHAGTPKYVFYFIGDGMGFSQRHLAELFLKEKEKDPTRKLVMNSLDVAGVITSHSANSLITDSAAAGTALASGVKTNNGVIGKDSAGKNVTTLIEAAEIKGLATGIISTTRLTHATPAAFVAHNENRRNEAEIALDFLKSNVAFLAGGGIRAFIPSGSRSGHKDAKGKTLYSKRKDTLDLVGDFEAKGYHAYIGLQGALDFSQADFTKLEKVLALFTNSHLPYEIERRHKYKHAPSLAAMTQAGIDVLQQDPDGFFMVIEGGRIDHAAHANDPASVIYDTLALDKAVRVAFQFYQAHQDETLILVVADHETGGLGLGSDAHGYQLKLSAVFNTRVSVEDTLNGSNRYNGDRERYLYFLGTEFGLTHLTSKEKATLRQSMSAADNGKTSGYGGYMSPVSLTSARILSERVNIKWTTTIHTGTVIPLSAIGANAHRFSGWLDNTQVATVMADVMDFEL